MPLKLTADALRSCWPDAPKPIIDAFVARQSVLARAGILETPQRLADCLANLAQETNGWTVKNLTENINYSHKRVAEVWKSRFPGGTSEVLAKYGNAPGWQLKMFDNVYGNRMGNRPGTNVGSKFI